MTSLFDLSQKHILVTGSNAGIGLQIARGLAQHGAHVILNGRNESKLQGAAEALRSEGLSVSEARFDLTQYARTTTGPYTAAKGGLKMLTKAMCADWARFNIQVNAIGPGYFITEMTQVLADDPKFDGWVKQRTPAARWGIPSELIGAAVFLSSVASSFVDGQIIYVDGGMSAAL